MAAYRRLLIGSGTALALVAVDRTGLEAWASIAVVLLVIVVAALALRAASHRLRIRTPQHGLVIVEAETVPGAWQGRLEPLYTSGFYCAFRVVDPARGKRLFGLFRDELDPSSWRRLQVAVRAN